MAVASMTGFARSQGRTESGATWVWEARSVNHKGLDLRCRVPSGFEAWETKVRDATTQRFTRGAITVGLVLNGVAEAPAYTLNEPLLNELVRMAQALRARHGEALAPPSIDGLLAVKGVLEVGEDSPDPEQTQARDTALQDSLERLLALQNQDGGWSWAPTATDAINSTLRLLGDCFTCPNTRL